MDGEDNALGICVQGVTGLQNTQNSSRLPLYFVRGLSPERAIRAAATGRILRKPVPVLHGTHHRNKNGKGRVNIGEVYFKKYNY